MIEIEFDININPHQFMSMKDSDRELLINSLSEKEKFESLNMFRTLPGGKVEWNDKKLT